MCKKCGIPACNCRKVISKAGERGKVGPRGPKGDKGSKGDKGDKGDPGADGGEELLQFINKTNAGVSNPSVEGGGYDLAVTAGLAGQNLQVWGHVTVEADSPSNIQVAIVGSITGGDTSTSPESTLPPVVSGGKTKISIPVSYNAAFGVNETLSINITSDGVATGAVLKTAQLLYKLITP